MLTTHSPHTHTLATQLPHNRTLTITLTHYSRPHIPQFRETRSIFLRNTKLVSHEILENFVQKKLQCQPYISVSFLIWIPGVKNKNDRKIVIKKLKWKIPVLDFLVCWHFLAIFDSWIRILGSRSLIMRIRIHVTG